MVKYDGMYDLLNLEITCFLKVVEVDNVLLNHLQGHSIV